MLNKLIKLYRCGTSLSELWLMPILVLIMRLWMAKIWWYSGVSKIDSWQQTLYLFQYEYKTPFLPYEVSAYLATATELITPFMLLFGFATRLATIPMLCMVAVIEFTYLQLAEHAYWAMLLGTILFYGPGFCSIDAFIKRHFKK